jgi:hypothetical protein
MSHNATQQLVAAIGIATKAHGLQEDNAGLPYILHPLYVMGQMDTVDEMIVAVLHDVVEDTAVGLDEIRNHPAYFSNDIIEAIDAITKRGGESNEDYWTRVKANPLALRVKLMDMAHNCSPERLDHLHYKTADYLRSKYADAREFFFKDFGLIPLMIGQDYEDAMLFLRKAGYDDADLCEMMFQAQKEGLITLKSGWIE